jgi:hypothetical protein
MPLIPGITAGAGSSIPISAGGGTSGAATSGFLGAPINIGGLFASGSQSGDTDSLLPIVVAGGIILLVGVFLLRRR